MAGLAAHDAAVDAVVVFVGAYRVIGSLFVLRWPFWGAVVAVVCDLGDLLLFNLFAVHGGWSGLADYQAFDKWLDQVYLVAFLAVALRDFAPLAKGIAVALYLLRLMGFIAFETGIAPREALLLFPNLFEFWFIAVAFTMRFRPTFAWTPARSARRPCGAAGGQARPGMGAPRRPPLRRDDVPGRPRVCLECDHGALPRSVTSAIRASGAPSAGGSMPCRAHAVPASHGGNPTEKCPPGINAAPHPSPRCLTGINGAEPESKSPVRRQLGVCAASRGARMRESIPRDIEEHDTVGTRIAGWNQGQWRRAPGVEPGTGRCRGRAWVPLQGSRVPRRPSRLLPSRR